MTTPLRHDCLPVERVLDLGMYRLWRFVTFTGALVDGGADSITAMGICWWGAGNMRVLYCHGLNLVISCSIHGWNGDFVASLKR